MVSLSDVHNDMQSPLQCRRTPIDLSGKYCPSGCDLESYQCGAAICLHSLGFNKSNSRRISQIICDDDDDAHRRQRTPPACKCNAARTLSGPKSHLSQPSPRRTHHSRDFQTRAEGATTRWFQGPSCTCGDEHHLWTGGE